MSLTNIHEWHKRARPNPTAENFSVQLGCHFEEVGEMLEALVFTSGQNSTKGSETVLYAAIKALADSLKDGVTTAEVVDRKDLLDALADQVVTSVGVAHCAHMDAPAACERVDASNWSKYDAGGQPIFKPNGKIDKGPGYQPPNLEGLY